jgi:O-antigen ligase
MDPRLPSLLRDRERLDRILYTAHTVCGAIWLIGASGPISVVEFAGIPLGCCFFLRAALARRLWLAPFTFPLILLLALWAAWQGISLLWTPDVPQGLDELGAMRFLWSAWMLYPIIAERRTLIGAYAAGFLLGNAAQIAHYLFPDAIWHRQPDRFSGWWEPVAGGVILCSALGLHLPAAFMGRGRERLFGVGGASASALGILLTGTRGAWLAGAALTGLGATLTLWRLRRSAARPGAIGLGALIVALGATWLLAGPSITARFDRAVTEVRAAIENKDFSTDTGARLLMNWWAMQAFERHPIVGVGAGGYRDWVIAHLDTTGVDPSRIHDQAHSSPLHIAATNGLIGLAVIASVAAVALRAARSRIRDDAPGGGWGSYQAGPLFALLGLFLVSATNTIHISAQPAAHLAILFALSPPTPRARPEPGA